MAGNAKRRSLGSVGTLRGTGIHPWNTVLTLGCLLSLVLGQGCEDEPSPSTADPETMVMTDTGMAPEVSGDSGDLDSAVSDAAEPMDVLDGPPPPIPPDASRTPVPALRLNEIHCRGEEWIEVYFGGPGPLSLNGWTLTDENEAADEVYRFPDEMIQPGTAWATSPENGLPFKIGCGSDSIRLRDPLGRVADEVTVGEPERGLTWGRLPDGEGEWVPNQATPGALNAPPAAPEARINEIDCRGRARVELVSIDGHDIDLDGWTLSAMTDENENPSGPHQLSGRIEADEFHLVRQQTQTDDGFVFEIACARQTVSLHRPDGSVADTVHLAFVPAVYSWGRLPDGEGEWQRTAPTLGDPNALPAPENTLPFDPNQVLEIDLEFAPGSREALEDAPREYVAARMTIREHTPDPLVVGIRIKGRAGSFRRLDQKPAWKVKLDFTVPGQRLMGRERMTLNSMVQDPSQIHEWTAYSIFRTLGLPAPRVGYAFVRLDGEVYGLYTIIESPDDDLLGRWFATTQHLYEGGYGQDLFPQHIDQLEADRGDLIERDDLRGVVERLEAGPLEAFYGNSDDIIHWETVIMTMATEVWTGHWDGYAPTRNNYYFHFDDDSKLTLLPWGTDQTFNRDIDFHGGRGRLMEACMAAPVCRGRYDQALAAVDRHVQALELPAAIRALAERLRPWQEMDDRSGRSANQLADQVERTIAFIERRHAAAADALECLLGPNADPDNDGHLCEADCNNDDPTIYPGAPEICGDRIDQDCNGTPDDGLECPDCVPVGQADHLYWICPNRRSFEDAVAHCAAEDAQLVHIQSAAENEWVRRTALEIRGQDYWVGLTDEAEQGVFRWPDGSDPEAFDAWQPGEPNGNDREDCVSIRLDTGTWYDRRCGDQVAVICEAPCPDATDSDEDGVSICAGDCDDTDGRRAPGLAETCDDAIDNDCDGAVDEGRDCTCRGRVRGDSRYFFCGEGAPWADARTECEARGGDLAVIEDAEENAYLRAQASGIARDNWWIGLSDIEEEGTFAWIDGQALDFRNWSRNEPNDWRTGEDCGELISGTGLWNDFRCDAGRPFICEGPMVAEEP